MCMDDGHIRPQCRDSCHFFTGEWIGDGLHLTGQLRSSLLESHDGLERYTVYACPSPAITLAQACSYTVISRFERLSGNWDQAEHFKTDISRID